MNERIKELFEEAGANQNTLAVLKRTTYFDPERFAELIIQECISLAQSHPSQIEDFAAGIDSVRENIKEHFGVK